MLETEISYNTNTNGKEKKSKKIHKYLIINNNKLCLIRSDWVCVRKINGEKTLKLYNKIIIIFYFEFVQVSM